jgi:uncharacterized OB-fold protein
MIPHSKLACWNPPTSPRNWVRLRGQLRILSSWTVYRIKVHFKDSKDNLIKTVEANEGDDILAIAHEYDIDLEGVYMPFCTFL